MALPDVQWPTLLSDWSSRADVLREVRRDGAALAFATSPLRGDREVVEAAVSGGGGLALEFASAELRADKDIVLTALRSAGMALRFAASHLLAERDVAQQACQQDGRALALLPVALRGDRELVAIAIRNDWRALEHATVALRCDSVMVGLAVQQDWRALRLAATPHEAAVDQGKASGSVPTSSQLTNSAATPTTTTTTNATSSDLRTHGIVRGVAAPRRRKASSALWAVAAAGPKETFAPPKLNAPTPPRILPGGPRADKWLVIKAVERDGRALKFAHESLRRDPDVVQAAVSSSAGPPALYFADEQLRSTHELFKDKWRSLQNAADSFYG